MQSFFFFHVYVKFFLCCYDIIPEVDQFIKKKMMDVEPGYFEIRRPHLARGLAALVHGRDGRMVWHVAADCRRQSCHHPTLQRTHAAPREL